MKKITRTLVDNIISVATLAEDLSVKQEDLHIYTEKPLTEEKCRKEAKKIYPEGRYVTSTATVKTYCMDVETFVRYSSKEE